MKNISNNVLITGGAGFIGSHAAEFYAKSAEIDKVFVLDNLSRSNLLKRDIKNSLYNWDYLHQFQNINFLKNDIKDFKFLKQIFQENEFNIVIHTAAQTAVTTSVIDPISDFENNVTGTFNILEAARVSKINPIMILCSTNKVFGNNVNLCEIRETDSRYTFTEDNINGISENFSIDLCEHTPYGASKLSSDIYFQEYGHLYDLKTAVFRMSCIYGTRQFGVEDQGWVAHFILSALTGKKLNIFGDGKQVRDVLYVSDLIEVYDAFIKKADSIKHDVFCMGGGPENTLSLLELIDILKKQINKEIKYEFFDWRPSDQKVYISNITKAMKKLDWKPKVKPKEGVLKLINWASQNLHLFE
ncbi:MAG: GDP-mannose 4,6-dehydratase [Candidatus Hodarchaeota archaeon]